MTTLGELFPDGPTGELRRRLSAAHTGRTVDDVTAAVDDALGRARRRMAGAGLTFAGASAALVAARCAGCVQEEAQLVAEAQERLAVVARGVDLQAVADEVARREQMFERRNIAGERPAAMSPKRAALGSVYDDLVTGRW